MQEYIYIYKRHALKYKNIIIKEITCTKHNKSQCKINNNNTIIVSIFQMLFKSNLQLI